jgi:hypothetical protein
MEFIFGVLFLDSLFIPHSPDDALSFGTDGAIQI